VGDGWALFGALLPPQQQPPARRTAKMPVLGTKGVPGYLGTWVSPRSLIVGTWRPAEGGHCANAHRFSNPSSGGVEGRGVDKLWTGHPCGHWQRHPPPDCLERLNCPNCARYPSCTQCPHPRHLPDPVQH